MSQHLGCVWSGTTAGSLHRPWSFSAFSYPPIGAECPSSLLGSPLTVEMQHGGSVALCSPCLACVPQTWAEALSAFLLLLPMAAVPYTIFVVCLGCQGVPCPSQPVVDLYSVQGLQPKRTPVPPSHGMDFCLCLFPRSSRLSLTPKDWDASSPLSVV